MQKLATQLSALISSCLLSFVSNAGEWTNYSISLSAGPVIGTDELRGAERAYSLFMGGQNTGNNGSSNTANGTNNGSITIKDKDKSISFTRTKRRVMKQVAVSTDYSLNESFSVKLASALSASDSRYYFEEGIAPLLDPLTLTFSESRVEFKAGVQYLAPQLLKLEPSLGVGVLSQFQWSRTRLNSVLIDVTDKHFQQDNGLYLNTSVTLSDFPVAAFIEAQRYSADDYSACAGLRLNLAF
jgi:hypothetical protein